jgi:hypothetical protein
MLRTLVTVALALLWAPQIYAGLSEDESTVTRDCTHLSCKDHKINDLGSYRIHVMHREDGSTINEYVTAAGKVFAVTWSEGRRHPDLSKLLGLHYKEYQDANTLIPSRSKGRPSRTVETANIKIVEGGQMGSVQGRAWVPKLIPSGVSIGEIQ